MATTQFAPTRITAPTPFAEATSRSALLRSARQGDRDALAQLVMPYASNLYRSSLRLTGNVHDAEDVRQETLLKALTRLDQFVGAQSETRDDLYAWVSRIGTNASIDVIRRRREGKTFSLDQTSATSDETMASQIPSRHANPEQGYLRHESKRRLAAAISELPPDLRQVCLLLDVLHYSTQEVAERLGISNVAVRLRLFRAHRKLREKLTGKLRSAGVEIRRRNSASGNWTTGRAIPCQAIGFACGGD